MSDRRPETGIAAWQLGFSLAVFLVLVWASTHLSNKFATALITSAQVVTALLIVFLTINLARRAQQQVDAARDQVTAVTEQVKVERQAVEASERHAQAALRATLIAQADARTSALVLQRVRHANFEISAPSQAHPWQPVITPLHLDQLNMEDTIKSTISFLFRLSGPAPTYLRVTESPRVVSIAGPARADWDPGDVWPAQQDKDQIRPALWPGRESFRLDWSVYLPASIMGRCNYLAPDLDGSPNRVVFESTSLDGAVVDTIDVTFTAQVLAVQGRLSGLHVSAQHTTPPSRRYPHIDPGT